MKESEKINKTKIIIICGATATGKSDFAVSVARELKKKKVGVEIISADSRQVYKGLDIGSGKITKKEMHGIPHHLLDVANPKNTFTVAQYKKLTERKIKEIVTEKNIPMIVGGTGFYIDTVVSGNTFPEVPPNQTLRKELYSKSAIALFEYLKKLDPVRAENIDSKNKVRLVRAIEIAKALGKVPLPKRQDLLGSSNNLQESPYDVLWFGLTIPDEILKERIHTRLTKRMRNNKMLKEMESLHNMPTGGKLSWKRMEMLGLEYRYGALYLQNKISKEEMLNKIESESWQYVKRQKTWWKRNKNIVWIDPREKDCLKNTVAKIKDFMVY